jgi:hypothetical protein
LYGTSKSWPRGDRGLPQGSILSPLASKIFCSGLQLALDKISDEAGIPGLGAMYCDNLFLPMWTEPKSTDNLAVFLKRSGELFRQMACPIKPESCEILRCGPVPDFESTWSTFSLSSFSFLNGENEQLNFSICKNSSKILGVTFSSDCMFEENSEKMKKTGNRWLAIALARANNCYEAIEYSRLTFLSRMTFCPIQADIDVNYSWKSSWRLANRIIADLKLPESFTRYALFLNKNNGGLGVKMYWLEISLIQPARTLLWSLHEVGYFAEWYNRLAYDTTIPSEDSTIANVIKRMEKWGVAIIDNQYKTVSRITNSLHEGEKQYAKLSQKPDEKPLLFGFGTTNQKKLVKIWPQLRAILINNKVVEKWNTHVKESINRIIESEFSDHMEKISLAAKKSWVQANRDFQIELIARGFDDRYSKIKRNIWELGNNGEDWDGNGDPIENYIETLRYSTAKKEKPFIWATDGSKDKMGNSAAWTKFELPKSLCMSSTPIRTDHLLCSEWEKYRICPLPSSYGMFENNNVYCENQAVANVLKHEQNPGVIITDSMATLQWLSKKKLTKREVLKKSNLPLFSRLKDLATQTTETGWGHELKALTDQLDEMAIQYPNLLVAGPKLGNKKIYWTRAHQNDKEEVVDKLRFIVSANAQADKVAAIRRDKKQLAAVQYLPLTKERYCLSFRGRMCSDEAGKSLRKAAQSFVKNAVRCTKEGRELLDYDLDTTNLESTIYFQTELDSVLKLINVIPVGTIRGSKLRLDGMVMQNRLGCMIKKTQIENCPLCDSMWSEDEQRHLMTVCTHESMIRLKGELEKNLCDCLGVKENTLRKIFPGLYDVSARDLTHRGLISRSVLEEIKKVVKSDIKQVTVRLTIIITIIAAATKELIEKTLDEREVE